MDDPRTASEGAVWTAALLLLEVQAETEIEMVVDESAVGREIALPLVETVTEAIVGTETEEEAVFMAVDPVEGEEDTDLLIVVITMEEAHPREEAIAAIVEEAVVIGERPHLREAVIEMADETVDVVVVVVMTEIEMLQEGVKGWV